jgi:hypothetical protein
MVKYLQIISIFFIITSIVTSGVYFYISPMTFGYENTWTKNVDLHIYVSPESIYNFSENMNCVQYPKTETINKTGLLFFKHLYCNFNGLTGISTFILSNTQLPMFISEYNISWFYYWLKGYGNNMDYIPARSYPFQLGTYYTEINADIVSWNGKDYDTYYYFNSQTINDPDLPKNTTVIYFDQGYFRKTTQHSYSHQYILLIFTSITLILSLITLIISIFYKKSEKKNNEDIYFSL